MSDIRPHIKSANGVIGSPTPAFPSSATSDSLYRQQNNTPGSTYGSSALATTHERHPGPLDSVVPQQRATSCSTNQRSDTASEQIYQIHPQQSVFTSSRERNHRYTLAPEVVYAHHQPLPEKFEPEGSGHQQHLYPHSSGTGPSGKWTFGLFDCCSPLPTCCMSFWCSCFLFGRTYARENGEGETSGVGLMCLAWFCSTQFCLCGFLQCFARERQRKRYGIESNSFNDFCLSCCCGCCTMVQEEKESIIRLTGVDPVTKVEYQPVTQGMYYPA